MLSFGLFLVAASLFFPGCLSSSGSPVAAPVKTLGPMVITEDSVVVPLMVEDEPQYLMFNYPKGEMLKAFKEGKSYKATKLGSQNTFDADLLKKPQTVTLTNGVKLTFTLTGADVTVAFEYAEASDLVKRLTVETPAKEKFEVITSTVENNVTKIPIKKMNGEWLMLPVDSTVICGYQPEVEGSIADSAACTDGTINYYVIKRSDSFFSFLAIRKDFAEKAVTVKEAQATASAFAHDFDVSLPKDALEALKKHPFSPNMWLAVAKENPLYASLGAGGLVAVVALSGYALSGLFSQRVAPARRVRRRRQH